MGWRDVLLRGWRQYIGLEPGPPPELAAAPEAPAVGEPARDDADLPGLRPDPDETIRAEMAVMATRAAERAQEEERENHRVSLMAPSHRLEYRRMRWEAINAAHLRGMSSQRIDQEYRSFRFAQWEQQNAQRIASMSPAERQESFRSEEMLTRYRAGLPPRDDEERDAYREWRQLDADVVNAYRDEVEIPERLWDEYVQSNGPLSREEFFAQYFRALTEEGRASESAAPSSTDHRSVPGADVTESAGPPGGVKAAGGVKAVGELSPEFPDADDSPGTARRLPGPAGAGSGLEDGPMSPFAPDGTTPRDGNAPDAGPPLLVPLGEPGVPGQVPAGHGEAPNGPVPW